MILHTLSERIADYFFDSQDPYSPDIYTYGIELTISSFIGTLLVFLMGIFTHNLIESVLFMIALTSVRVFSGGYHANTYLKCNAITVLTAAFSLAVKQVICSLLSVSAVLFLIIGITLLLLVTVFVFCPIENKNKPIDVNDRPKFKWLSATMVTIQALACFVFFFIYGFDQVLVIIPTMFVVMMSILVEIILKQRRNCHEKSNEEGC